MLNHNRQLLGLAASVVNRHDVKPIQRDPSIAAEDALRLKAAQGLVSAVTGRTGAGKASEAIQQVRDEDRRANGLEEQRRGDPKASRIARAPAGR